MPCRVRTHLNSDLDDNGAEANTWGLFADVILPRRFAGSPGSAGVARSIADKLINPAWIEAAAPSAQGSAKNWLFL